MDHGESEPGRNRRVDRITALLHDLYANLRGQSMYADNHCVLGMDRICRGNRWRRHGYESRHQAADQ